MEGMEAVRQDAKARMDAAQLQMKQAFDRKHSVKEPKISSGRRGVGQAPESKEVWRPLGRTC